MSVVTTIIVMHCCAEFRGGQVKGVADNLMAGGEGKPVVEMGDLGKRDYAAVEACRACLPDPRADEVGK